MTGPAAPPLRVGPLAVWPPVVLAPMAGITNAPFRRLCQGFVAGPCEPAVPPGSGQAGDGGAHGGLFVSEMITARGLAERNDKTLRMARFADDEPVRSIQLYGTDPRSMGDAARFLAERRARRPHRPQLRLPRRQGHPQGRRRGAAGAPGAVPPRSCGPRCGARATCP